MSDVSDAFCDFVDALVDYGLLISTGEAVVLARVHRNYRGHLNWMAVMDVCATRAAHKKLKHLERW